MMKKNILSQNYYIDSVSQTFIQRIENNITQLDNAVLYYDFPFAQDALGNTILSNIMIVSPVYGVLLFKCDPIQKDREGDHIRKIDEGLTATETLIFSKLIKSNNKNIKKGRRDLNFTLCSAVYIPKYSGAHEPDNAVLKTITDIKAFFKEAQNTTILDAETMKEIFSVIDSSNVIIKSKERKISTDDTSSKAYILKEMEAVIARFDDKQKYAALSQLIGPQRIRGLAGSGKTIILCMKAAILHYRNPNLRILYTFTTKSLYDYIENLITRFYKSLSDGFTPDFDNSIIIRHSWGGENIKGVYYEACADNAIMPIDFRSAASKSGRDGAFDYICKELLRQTKGQLNQKYDYVLIDEAQDFKPSFYQLCRAIVKNDCLVWCYDELQNIFQVELQDTMTTFKNEFGAQGIDLGVLQESYPEMDNDIVLPKSYRNPKEVLVMAHAIGFGIYNDRLIQMLQNNAHWEDLGYHVIEGNCNNDEHMIIERRPECSPLPLDQYQAKDEIIKWKSCDTIDDEILWITDAIENSIKEDKLRADDIMVICIDDKNVKHYFEELSQSLRVRKINSHNLSNTYYEKGFAEDNCVTLTTVYKAKGNESAMVFVIGCDVVEPQKDNRTMRNKLFTAFTRSKAWLRISGIKIEQSSLVREIKDVMNRDFILDFVYKNAPVIERDLSEANGKKALQRRLMDDLIEKAHERGMSDEEIDQMMSDRAYELRGNKK